MNIIYLMVLCWLAADVAVADAYYTAAVWTGGGGGGGGGDHGNPGRCEAVSAAVHGVAAAAVASAASAASAREKADIMVLPSEETDSEDCDKVVRVLSEAARPSTLCLVAPLTLSAHPPRPGEMTTLVFDRQGAILAVSRKPTCNEANNTVIPSSAQSPVSFRTDFGVTFSLLGEELVLGTPPPLAPADVRDVVLAGNCHYEIPNFNGPQNDVVSYGLAAFDGTRHFQGSKYIGPQNCAVSACTGLYKRTCNFGSIKNNTNVIFEKLSISANLSNESTVPMTVPYPVILSDHHIPSEHFEYVTKSVGHGKTVKMTVTGADCLLGFGAFGRVFERDYDSFSESKVHVDLYNYIFNDDVDEFFDYLYIRVRILIVIVSIYVLEMM